MPSTVSRRREGSAAHRHQQRASQSAKAARAVRSARPCGARQQRAGLPVQPANAGPPPPGTAPREPAAKRHRLSSTAQTPQAGARAGQRRACCLIHRAAPSQTRELRGKKQKKGPAAEASAVVNEYPAAAAAEALRASAKPDQKCKHPKACARQGAPEAGHRATQSRRQHVQGTAARWCIAPGSAQQTADASGKKVRRSA